MTRSAPFPSSVAAALEARAQSFGIPGLAIVCVGPDREAQFLYGEDAAGSGRPVSAETWFSAASTGKHLTACAVIALAQQGTLHLADPIGKHLPDIRRAWADRSVGALMRHTSGLPEYLTYTEADAPPETREAFFAAYSGLTPVFDENAAWMYSNTNYILLGFLIAALSGQSYAAFVQTIFDAQRCRGATVGSPGWARAANAAAAGPDARDAASANRAVIGDGDVAFTMGGAADWLRALLGGLDAPSRATLFAPARFATGRMSFYGGGWFVEPLGQRTLIHHAGHYDGWTAMAMLAPAHGAGVMALCNLAPGHTRAIRALAQQALEAFAPGATPCALADAPDDESARTARVRAALFRTADAIDRSLFAAELQPLLDAGGVRGVINLWTGSPPDAFTPVDRHDLAETRVRRYRIRYPDRIDHVLVGLTPRDEIYWAWPV